MYQFRHVQPNRSNITQAVSDYKEYRPFLVKDFNERCGYCNDIHKWRVERFEIDHFIPQSKFSHRDPRDYTNLVYSCRSCNNSKRAKWPTEDETLPNNGVIGFVDPCSREYDEHLGRNKEGVITFKTELGKWMFHALKLHKTQHQFIYLIEQIDKNIDELENLSTSLNEEVLNKEEIRENLLTLHQMFRKYSNKLSSI